MIDLQGIKNIIFDYGGVIINIDPKLTIKAFQKLGIYNAERLFTDVNVSGMLTKLELGQISNAEFLQYVKQLSAREVTFQEITDAWNAMLLDIPPQRIKLLKELKQQYRIYLLSNTNDIHYKFYHPIFVKATGGESFQSFFHKAYFSFEIKQRKPTVDIYKYVLQDQQLLPSETLFIDDSLENIEIAKTLGIKTHWLTNELILNFPSINQQSRSNSTTFLQ